VNRLILGLATVGYLGYFPFAPGTAGTAAGILIFLLFSSFTPAAYLLGTGILFVLACWVAGRAEAILGRKDSPRIIIDELVGYLITMALLPCTLTTVAGGFLFFRLLDIIKPPPAGSINRRMEGGLAIVLDDAVAGVYANLLLQAAVHWRSDILFTLDRWLLGPG
jgi:phosphatidylglycerophosphatase A